MCKFAHIRPWYHLQQLARNLYIENEISMKKLHFLDSLVATGYTLWNATISNVGVCFRFFVIVRSRNLRPRSETVTPQQWNVIRILNIRSVLLFVTCAVNQRWWTWYKPEIWWKILLIRRW